MVVMLNVSSVLPVLVSTTEPNTDSPGAAASLSTRTSRVAPANTGSMVMLTASLTASLEVETLRKV